MFSIPTGWASSKDKEIRNVRRSFDVILRGIHGIETWAPPGFFRGDSQKICLLT
jgi:hypothetical protein